MEASDEKETGVVKDPTEWAYMNQGGHHIAFGGVKQWQGFVLKAKKAAKAVEGETDTKIAAAEDEKLDPLASGVVESKILGKYAPKTVNFSHQVACQGRSSSITKFLFPIVGSSEASVHCPPTKEV